MSLVLYMDHKDPPRYRDLVFGIMEKRDLPINLVCVGMAGSGKSSFLKVPTYSSSPLLGIVGLFAREGVQF